MSSQSNIYAAAHLITSIAKFANFEGMNDLKKKYDQLCNDYQNDSKLAVSSHIDFSRLESFNQWIPKALNNKKAIIPFLVSNMLEGDIYSLSMYDALYNANNKKDLVIDYSKILSTPDIKAKFTQYGGAEDSRSIITAEHWLKSEEAANIFKEHDSLEDFCAANSVLHIINEYVDC